MTLAGLSHSEIHGLTPACGSPWLIATYYVLHRLLAPRHSPNALSSLITKFAIEFALNRTQRTVICPKSMCSCQRTLEIPADELPIAIFANRDFRKHSKWISFAVRRFRMVGVTGVEPVTLRLSSACSNQLSYTPRRLRRNFKFQIRN